MTGGWCHGFPGLSIWGLDEFGVWGLGCGNLSSFECFLLVSSLECFGFRHAQRVDLSGYAGHLTTQKLSNDVFLMSAFTAPTKHECT